jgi:ABC-2 type transport system permease protein
MSELMIIIRREFIERVGTRAFMIGTVLFPLFLIATFLLPQLLMGGSKERPVAVVSEGPAGIAESFAAVLGAEPEDEDDDRYVVERVGGTIAENREALNARLTAEEIEGYIVIPADVLESNEVVYRATSIANFGVQRDIRRAASQAVQAERLQIAGLDGGEVAELFRPVEVSTARVTEQGEEAGDAETTFWMAYIVMFLVYFMTAFYGVNVMRGVLEEKTNRIAEVMVSSVPASHLMLGKILGVGAAALLQVGIWALFVALLASSDAIAAQMGLTDDVRGALAIDPGTGVLLLIYFVLGFLLFAAVFAAVGAAMTSEQEAQSLQMVVMVPLFVPILFLGQLTGEPLGTAATVLGLIPFTAPIAMPARLATIALPPLQVALSIALMLAAIALVGWLAGKIYRVGILSTGKKPSLKELGRWLRAA